MSSKDTVATVAEALSKKLELKAGDKMCIRDRVMGIPMCIYSADMKVPS